MRYGCLFCASVAVLALAGVGCGGETTTYGASPEGLKGATLPSPNSGNPPPGQDAGANPPPDDAAATGDSGGAQDSAVGPLGDAGVPPPVDSGAGALCGVSWTTTIYPDLTNKWGCSAGGTCHGAGTSPTMVNPTATSVYDSFKAFTPAMGSPGGLPYILPGSTLPTQSSFLCSVDPTGTCGALMPLGDTAGNTPVTAQDLQNITTWVKCGAPLN